MRKEHIIRRIIVLIVGLWIMAMGVAFSIAANLGTSPISSVPYTVSLLSPLSVGEVTIAMHCTFILLQIILLKKEYRAEQLLQLPIALIFGLMTDLAVSILSSLHPSGYIESWILTMLGIVFVATGVSAEVNSDTVPLAGEGLALALSNRLGIRFGNAKIAVDVSLVIISLALSFSFLKSFGGVREGTVAAAVLVGTIAKKLNKTVLPLKEKYL